MNIMKREIPLGDLYNGGKTKVHREWRGLKDSWFDYKCWVKNWKALLLFLFLRSFILSYSYSGRHQKNLKKKHYKKRNKNMRL